MKTRLLIILYLNVICLQVRANTTQPLNSFFAEFISKITFRKFEEIERTLEKQPEQFYGVIDEKDKTILHVA